jgi:tRNA (cmo5U34)-methyltransferase
MINKGFNFDSVEDFDKHIYLSIPNYDFLCEHIQYLIETLTEIDTTIFDIGCSTGKLLKNIDKNPSCSYIGMDMSSIISVDGSENVSFIKKDITKEDFPDNCSVISSVFTLQFLPSHERKNVIKKAYDSLNEGGHFIVCEKTHSEIPAIESITNSIYYRFKSKNFTPEEIFKKQQELAVSMKLKTSPMIFDELKEFSYVEIFWKSYGFMGFLAKK